MNLERVMTYATEAASWPDAGVDDEEVDDRLTRRTVSTIVTRASAADSAEVRALLDMLAATVDRRAVAQERWEQALARERELEATRWQVTPVWGVLIAAAAAALLPFAGVAVLPVVILPNVRNLLAPVLAHLTDRAGQACWRIDGQIRHRLIELANRVAPDTSWLDPLRGPGSL